MTTSAQISANQANAQRSTGPRTDEGKAIASVNNLRHGFTGKFRVLDWEDPGELEALFVELRAEHQPSTITENALVDKMAQSLWLGKRALILQNESLNTRQPGCNDEHQLALYIRYQTTQDRAFHKSLDQLLKLRAAKRKQEIGFESQAHKQADQTRRAAAENRKQELHHYSVMLAEAKLDHQQIQNSFLKTSHLAAPSSEEELSFQSGRAA